jgi:hypothetical protein
MANRADRAVFVFPDARSAVAVAGLLTTTFGLGFGGGGGSSLKC